VKSDRNGHTWLAAADLAAKLREMIPGADVMKAFKLALRARFLKKYRDRANAVWLSSYHRATSEERIAASLARLSAASCLWPTDRVPVSQVEGDRLPSQHQVDRLKLATAGPVGLLLGGPGTGKSHCTAYLLREVIKEFGHANICAVAPTGKAAVRITQALNLATIDLTAHTIHSTLEIGRNGHDGDGWGFVHNAKNPLPYQFLLCDECFVRGTLVDTPNGPKAIESLCVGDEVYSATGTDRIYGVSRKEVDHAIRITAGKASLICSEGHPFFTSRGWVRAIDLEPGDALVSTAAAMRLLRDNHQAEEVKRGPASFLRLCLLREMVDSVSGTQSQDEHSRSQGKARQGAIGFSSFRHTGSECTGGSYPSAQPHDERIHSPESFQTAPRYRTQAFRSGRQWPRSDRAATPSAFRPWFGMGNGVCGFAGQEDARLSDLLQARFGQPGTSYRHRNRWLIPQHDREETTGREEGCQAGFVEMDRVEILQQGHPDLDQYRDASGALYLYDLAVARHPSFSVNGCLVHNCSMLDTDLQADLLDACATGAHILMVGDPYQLPPVGHGAPLRDMIEARVPHGELTEVRRNAGQIVHACVRIKNGESFDTCSTPDLAPADGSPPKNLRLIEARDESHARERLVELLKNMQEKAGQHDKPDKSPHDFHPTWQTQVIVARNTKGEICRKRLNELLQPLLNPDGYSMAGNPFKVGDKIICTRNSYMHQVEGIYTGQADNADIAKLAENYEVLRDPEGQPEELYVANGEIGRVVAVAGKLTVARFSESDTLVKIPMGKQRDEDEGEGEGGEDGGGGGGRGCNFDLGYAITVHKAQGSEAPCVIVMADPQAGMIADRNWWYTAISRASKLCVIIGQKSVIDKQRLKQSLVRRKTFLREQILETRYAEL
jgi:ATP-dependent exoDNAse (exonuclease V) alpha subunit